MFTLNDIVKIKSSGIVGTVIDVSKGSDGNTKYIVENNKKGKVNGAYGGVWGLFDCTDSDLILIQQ